MKNILVIRFDGIGDVVLTTPFLRELKKSFPKARITLAVKTGAYDLVKLCPYADKVLQFSPPQGRHLFVKKIFAAFCFAYQYLWQTRYDLAIVPRWDSDASCGAGWVALFSRAIRRIGYSEYVYTGKAISDRGFNRFYTEVIDKREFTHEVERNLAVLRYLGGRIDDTHLEVWTSLEDEMYAVKWFNTYLPERKKLIVIALFLSAGSVLKEWGVSNYAEVLKRLHNQYRLHVILLGDKNNTEQYGRVFLREYGEEGVSNLIGKTSLRETIEIVKRCDLYFGGDTGPMHLAAACKILGIALFFMPKGICETIDGIFPPDRFGPWESNLLVLQPECGVGDNNFEGRIPSISVENVQAALKRTFDEIESFAAGNR